LSLYRITRLAHVLECDPGFFFEGAPTGFAIAAPVDTGTMGAGDTRRLLRAWDAITGIARKHVLGIALALARASSGMA
jgi:hypothetical protein